MAKSAIKKPMTKTEMFSEIADTTGLAKKDVAAVFNELVDIVDRHIRRRGPGVFTLPGLLKVKTVKKPARPAKFGVPNPFKPGEMMDVPAKPASIKVKALPLKKLKAMADK